MACAAGLLKHAKHPKQFSRSPHVQAIALLKESVGASDWELAVSVLSMAHASGVRHDQRSFSIALKASGRATAWEVACCLAPWMDRVGISLDSITFSTATTAIGYRWRLAFGLAAKMQKYLLFPDVVNYGSTISSCQQALQWSSALWLVGKMAHTALSANAVISGSLVSACSVVWKEALAIFDGMQKQQACSLVGTRRGDSDVSLASAAVFPFQSFPRSPKVRLNGVISNAMSAAYEQTGHWIAALQSLQQLAGSSA